MKTETTTTEADLLDLWVADATPTIREGGTWAAFGLALAEKTSAAASMAAGILQRGGAGEEAMQSVAYMAGNAHPWSDDDQVVAARGIRMAVAAHRGDLSQFN